MGSVLALVAAAMFSGAAIYIVIAEHPARSLLAPREQLVQWKPSYSRGAAMQASLALLAAILGALVWLRGGVCRRRAGCGWRAAGSWPGRSSGPLR